jgi:hypothetical protein
MDRPDEPGDDGRGLQCRSAQTRGIGARPALVIPGERRIGGATRGKGIQVGQTARACPAWIPFPSQCKRIARPGMTGERRSNATQIS